MRKNLGDAFKLLDTEDGTGTIGAAELKGASIIRRSAAVALQIPLDLQIKTWLTSVVGKMIRGAYVNGKGQAGQLPATSSPKSVSVVQLLSLTYLSADDERKLTAPRYSLYRRAPFLLR